MDVRTQSWDSAKKSNINKIQKYCPREINECPPYTSNHTLQTDLKQ